MLRLRCLTADVKWILRAQFPAQIQKAVFDFARALVQDKISRVDPQKLYQNSASFERESETEKTTLAGGINHRSCQDYTTLLRLCPEIHVVRCITVTAAKSHYNPPNNFCGLSLDKTDHVIQNWTMDI